MLIEVLSGDMQPIQNFFVNLTGFISYDLGHWAGVNG